MIMKAVKKKKKVDV